MTLNHQSSILAWLASIAVVAVLAITIFSAVEVRKQTEQIAMAENTAKGVTNFRFLIMETALYREQRSTEQWQRRAASFQDMLAVHRYSEANENALLAKEKINFEILSRLYEKLVNADSVSIMTPHTDTAALEVTANSVSTLFLVTQDMLDDAFELVRLNRLDLEAAQTRAARLTLLSIVVLAGLIAAGCIIIKRRVLVPVAALQKGAEQIAKGDLTSRLNLTIANEIGFLASTFDNMTEQLKESHDALKAENAERRHAQSALQETVQQLANRSIELARAQEELQIIIDHMPALVVYWDKELINRFANKAYLEWFGVTPQQMHGKHISEIIGQDRFEDISPFLLSALQGNTQLFERTIHYPAGATRHALFSYIPDIENGKVKGLYGFISDITQLKQAQAAQAAALAQLQSVVDAASEFAIIVTDLDGMIRMFSAGAEKMLGYAAQELVDKQTPAIIHLREEVMSRAAELTVQRGHSIEGFDTFVEQARHEQAETREWTYVRKGGSHLPVQLTVTPIFNVDRTITGFLGIAKDISQEKKATEELRVAMTKAESANRAKSEFVANMSHELRTPMNAVLGMTYLLGGTDLSVEQKKYLDMIRVSGRSLLAILNDILDFSKIEAGRMELSPTQFLLGDLLNALAAIMSINAAEKNLELAIGVEPNVPRRFLGDAMRLQQVLVNLTGNAIKFTEQGEVSILVEVVEQPDNPTSDLVMLRFNVRDTGIGMNLDQQSRLFVAFTQADSSMTRRFGGTGLGLTISKRLIDLMGGTIEVRSELGKGSHFSVTLPLQVANDQEDAKRLKSALGNLRFLIVDDNNTSRDYLTKTILAWNWEVESVDSGAQAVELVLAAKEKDESYDVILVDWQTPEMDGLSTADAIRKLNTKQQCPSFSWLTPSVVASLQKQLRLPTLMPFCSNPLLDLACSIPCMKF
ncbi:MAG: PAS domain S-box protein [Pseudomonadota bacterium]